MERGIFSQIIFFLRPFQWMTQLGTQLQCCSIQKLLKCMETFALKNQTVKIRRCIFCLPRWWLWWVRNCFAPCRRVLALSFSLLSSAELGLSNGCLGPGKEEMQSQECGCCTLRVLGALRFLQQWSLPQHHGKDGSAYSQWDFNGVNICLHSGGIFAPLELWMRIWRQQKAKGMRGSSVWSRALQEVQLWVGTALCTHSFLQGHARHHWSVLGLGCSAVICSFPTHRAGFRITSYRNVKCKEIHHQTYCKRKPFSVLCSKYGLTEKEGFAAESGQPSPWITALYEMWNPEWTHLHQQSWLPPELLLW